MNISIKDTINHKKNMYHEQISDTESNNNIDVENLKNLVLIERKYEELMIYYNKLIEANPFNPVYYNMKGITLCLIKNYH